MQSNDAFLQVLLFPYASKSWNWVKYIKILIINERFYLLTEIFRQPTKIKKFNRLPTKIENLNRLPTKHLNFNRQPTSGPPHSDPPLADQWPQNCRREHAERDQLEELRRAGKESWKRRSCGCLVSFLDSSAGYCFERSTATKDLCIFFIALESVWKLFNVCGGITRVYILRLGVLVEFVAVICS